MDGVPFVVVAVRQRRHRPSPFASAGNLCLAPTIRAGHLLFFFFFSLLSLSSSLYRFVME